MTPEEEKEVREKLETVSDTIEWCETQIDLLSNRLTGIDEKDQEIFDRMQCFEVKIDREKTIGEMIIEQYDKDKEDLE